MKKYTITEFAQLQGKSREAIFYQIKKGNLSAKKNKKNEWIISVEEEKKANNINTEIEVLKEKIRGLETELKNKDEIIKAKDETIEAEKRSNIALLYNLENKKEHQKILENSNIFKKLIFWKK